MVFNKNISKAIRQYRKNNNLSLNDFADKIDVTAATVCRWESGKQKIKSSHWLKLKNYISPYIDYFELGINELSDDEIKILVDYRNIKKVSKIAANQIKIDIESELNQLMLNDGFKVSSNKPIVSNLCKKNRFIYPNLALF